MSRKLVAPAAKRWLLNKTNAIEAIASKAEGCKSCVGFASTTNKQGVEVGDNGVLKLGLDVHYRQVTVAMQEAGIAELYASATGRRVSLPDLRCSLMPFAIRDDINNCVSM